MKRRPGSRNSAVPAALRSFDPAAWPVDTLWEAYSGWTAARWAWVEAGNSWPGGDVALGQEHVTVAAQLPDEPFDPRLM